MAELILGLHLEGAEVDVADLFGFLNSTKKIDFATLMTLLHKMTDVTITTVSKQTITIKPKKPTTVTTWTEKQLYPPP